MLDEQAKKTLLRKIPHGLYVCGVQNGEDMNGFTASWVMQASFQPPLVVNCVKNDSGSHEMLKQSGVFALSFFGSGSKRHGPKLFLSPSAASATSLKTSSFMQRQQPAVPSSKTPWGMLNVALWAALSMATTPFSSAKSWAQPSTVTANRCC